VGSKFAKRAGQLSFIISPFISQHKQGGIYEKMRQWQEMTTLRKLTQDTNKDELTDIEE